MQTIYEFTIKSLQGEELDFSQYKNKVLLLVNTASKCGFTPQYQGLQSLYEKYKGEGLEIVAFPCNQFGGQEPGDASVIAEGCLINYGVDFAVTEKIHVNGANSHPIYNFLKQARPGLLGESIKWNFTKFLVGKNGMPIKRFAPIVKPLKLAPFIEAALKA